MHPIDRLLALRQTMKTLRAEHDAIRSQIIRGEVELVGNYSVAKLRHSVRVSKLPAETAQPAQAAPQPHSNGHGTYAQ